MNSLSLSGVFFIRLKKTLYLSFLLISNLGLAQQSLQGSAAKTAVKKANFVKLDAHELPTLIRFEKGTTIPQIGDLSKTLNLSEGCDLRLSAKRKDLLGNEHLRYSQTYRGIPVMGAEYLVHCNAKQEVSLANGRLKDHLENVVTTPTFSPEAGLEKALTYIGAEVYMWQIPEEEALLKSMHSDAHSSYFPQGTLVITSEKYDDESAYRLAYQFDIYAQNPLGRYRVEVDALTGEIINSYNRIHHTNVSGTGESLYDSTVSIQLDFSAGNFHTVDSTRGGGIFTYDMYNGTSYGSAGLFQETDNYFDEANSMAGVSAHHGAAATYDYFLNNFGRDSYDGNATPIRSYVHYATNYFNAFWDGSRMTYGDGDGTTAKALVSLDIVGHEITHAVTEHSAGLVYSYESGALNESFSDIFGQAIEFETFPATASWNLGDQIFLDSVSMIRSMSDPNSQGQPDTYLGNYWYTGAGDNGGVHYNSGVQNYWFYLLVDGGSGTNDFGYNYTVPAIGLEAAQSIAYRNLTVYLTSTSQYADARVGAELAAADLFGYGSTQHNAVVEAWNAVGVPGSDPALAVGDSLGFGNVVVGLSKTSNLNISNTGSGSLVIFDLDINSDLFVPEDTAFIVAESETYDLPIIFTPLSLGDTSASATLYSNADTVTISLHGAGTEAPSFDISADSLNAVLNVGDSSGQVLTISNVATSGDLSFAVTIDFDAEDSATAVRLPSRMSTHANPDGSDVSRVSWIQNSSVDFADLKGKTIGYLNDTGGLVADLEDRGATVVNLRGSVYAQLEDLDALIMFDDISRLSYANLDVIRDWVQGGGNIWLQGDNSQSVDYLNYVLQGTGIEEVYIGFSDEVFTDIASHQINQRFQF